jgi:predicted nucleic acid-binding protein
MKRLERDEVATTEPVVLESLHRAKNHGEYEYLYTTLFEPLHRVGLTEDAAQRALAVQRELASTTHGNHLRPAIDYLVSAAAELAGDDVVLWFFDKDLRVICGHTGQPHEEEVA